MSAPQPNAGKGPPPRRRVTYRRPEPLPLAFFESEQARAAMGARDVQQVFAILARMGVSQRRIAALTGQSQSEVSEIRSGRRVRSVDVIERIADGLSTPRGWWGLAHTDDALPQLLEPAPGEPAAEAVSPATPTTVSIRRAVRPSHWAARVPPSDLVAARHLIGLVGALRLSLAPNSAPMRPSRAAGRTAQSAARLRRALRR